MSSEEVFVVNSVGVWRGAVERAGKLFNGLSDEELQKPVAPGRNRLIYLWGHLTAMHDRMNTLLGASERVKPSFDAFFLTAADGTSDLPSAQEVRSAWKQVSEQLNVRIASISPGDWLQKHTAVTEEDFAKDPLRNKLSILLTRTNHLSYHLGQTSLVPR